MLNIYLIITEIQENGLRTNNFSKVYYSLEDAKNEIEQISESNRFKSFIEDEDKVVISDDYITTNDFHEGDYFYAQIIPVTLDETKLLTLDGNKLNIFESE